MVLYKRKPVEYAPIPKEAREHPDAELWELRETGEIFIEYIDYLKRREFYLERNFTCEITGRSGLTYFDAVTSEANGTEQIRSQFPKPLRGPILKLVQFSTKGRIEQLVNDVYRTFKKDFYPGETVICISKNGDRRSGIVREKVTYPSNTPEGAVSFSKYAVSLKSKNSELSLFESTNITRDRRSFSKNLIRSFLRDSLTKAAWHGAPWVVKERLARELDLPLEVPIHLQQSTKLAEKRALARQRKAVSRARQRQKQDLSLADMGDADAKHTALLLSGPPAMQKPWQSKPGGKQKHRFIQHDIQTFQPGAQQQFVQLNRVQSNYRTVQYHANGDGHMQAVMLPPGDPNREFSPPLTTLTIQKKDPSPPFVPQVRYPIDDLDVPPRDEDIQRPRLKFFTDDHTSGMEKDQKSKTGRLEEKSVGPLLEVWNTLNVHNEVFILDSFTLDDFAQALCFSSLDVYCELLSEMHCAVLKQLVNDKGQLMVNLPQFDVASDESEDDEEESEEEEEEEAEPEPEPERRTTRGSLAKAEALALASQRDPTPEAIHSGAEFRQKYSWADLCKEREFKNGGWQAILTGLLYQLSLSDPMKARCDRILSHLVPLGTEPTVETIVEQYATLDVNLRLDALAMIVMLAVQTRAIREHLEKMSLEMTDLRKRRIEQQRLKKELVDQLQDLDMQRKELTVKHEASQTAEDKEKVDEDTPMADVPQTNGKHDSSDNSEDEAPRLRHRHERVIDRKRKREEEAARRAKERKEKAVATKLSKQETKLKKLTAQIDEKKEQIKECEEQILDLNNDLRETDCQRTKCLGRDRFCNRYYWFERNGMPFGGVPRTSTAHYGYANARLWVQGADADERAGFVDLPPAEQAAYRAQFGCTVPERQRREEGGTSLPSPSQWGYYDCEAEVDELVAWLDERGVRERALRKELVAWRDVIVECMEKLRLHREGEAERTGGGVGDTPKTRISTRTKTYVDMDTTRWTCLAWRNSMAIEELGLRHGDGVKRRGRPPKAKIALDRRGRLAGKRGGRGG